MKKAYEAPKVEKVEFEYSEAVVASNSCYNGDRYTNTAQEGPNCHSKRVEGTHEQTDLA